MSLPQSERGQFMAMECRDVMAGRASEYCHVRKYETLNPGNQRI